jgi:microcystin-dependent protein
MAVNKLFYYYEGTDPTQYTPLTGEVLNRNIKRLEHLTNVYENVGTSTNFLVRTNNNVQSLSSGDRFLIKSSIAGTGRPTLKIDATSGYEIRFSSTKNTTDPIFIPKANTIYEVMFMGSYFIVLNPHIHGTTVDELSLTDVYTKTQIDMFFSTLRGDVKTEHNTLKKLSDAIMNLSSDNSDIKKLISEEVSKIVPVGTVIWVAANKLPKGYLKCNGQAISRSTYSELFSFLGTIYGEGNGTTTFNLPDLRGEFIRGWDDGRGIDKSRTIGSSQSQMTGKHKHLQLFGENTSLTAPINTEINTEFGNSLSQTNDRFIGSNGGLDYDNVLFFTNDGTEFDYKNTKGESRVLDPNKNTGNIVGDENRPRNIALLACIKI